MKSEIDKKKPSYSKEELLNTWVLEGGLTVQVGDPPKKRFAFGPPVTLADGILQAFAEIENLSFVTDAFLDKVEVVSYDPIEHLLIVDYKQ